MCENVLENVIFASWLHFCAFELTDPEPRKESRDQPRTDKIEARHDDYNLPRTFESLEKSFREDIVVLSKELNDAEDAENTRHREVCSNSIA